MSVERKDCYLSDITMHILQAERGKPAATAVPLQRLREWRDRFNELYYGPRPAWAPPLDNTPATRPEREAQEAVAWRAVAHPETGMGTMVNQIKYRLIEDADSLYGKGRWTLEELVPRLTPPDAAATIARLEKERDEAHTAFANGAYDAALKTETSIYHHALALTVEKFRAAEAEAARLREAVSPLVDACFTEMHGDNCDDEADDEHVASTLDETGKVVPAGTITFGMIRRARAALDQPARDEVRG